MTVNEGTLLRVVRLQDLPKFAEEVAEKFLSHKREDFVLWLKGDLGAGKTTFARELLYALGVSRAVPVLSPTYTYMTEYDTSRGKIAHLDLYRLIDGDEDSVETLLSGRSFRGLIVEWPERAENSPFIQKTCEIHLAPTEGANEREIRVLADLRPT